jgi:hypothetical protein
MMDALMREYESSMCDTNRQQLTLRMAMLAKLGD